MSNVDSASTGSNNPLFESIAQDIESIGYCVKHNALPDPLLKLLFEKISQLRENCIQDIGVNRDLQLAPPGYMRTDDIFWIKGESPCEEKWLEWTDALMQHLNWRLYLDLFSFESHFSHFKKGGYYKQHLDSFKGRAGRKLSVVLFLNPEWLPHEGGELVIYPSGELAPKGNEEIKILPLSGTLVMFLSEEFPHEVLPTLKDRYSISGWFRINPGTQLSNTYW